MAFPAAPFITSQEYLEQERAAEFKSEYYAGEIYAMAGVSREHDLICVNLIAELRGALKGTPCEPHSSDLRVKVSPTGLYTYPDASVACGQPELEDTSVDTLLNPVLIVEVLSPKTEAYDRGAKFALYRSLPSLREYVMISQNQRLVEVYVRREGEWGYRAFCEPEQVVPFLEGKAQIPLAEIYDRVKFPQGAG